MNTLPPGSPAIAEPHAPARPPSRFIDMRGNIAWDGLGLENPTAREAVEILACEGGDGDTPEQVDTLLWSHDIDPAQVEVHRADVLAIAAHVRAGERAERQRLFRNQLASLRNIDMPDLVEAGVLTPLDKYGEVSRDPDHLHKQFRALSDDPQAFYLKLGDRRLLDDAVMEHVAVLYQDRPADMFVDEIGAIKSLPRNEAATAIYRANWLKQHPRTDPESLDAIYGPAVLFHRIVWS